MSDINDPGLDHYLEEVAAEVLRQDAAGLDAPIQQGTWKRAELLETGVALLRSVRAIDQEATPCTARHVVHEDGVTAEYPCHELGTHGMHKDSIGRSW